MRITADTGVCIGSGQCVLTEPAVFDQNDDGIVTLLTDHPTGDTATNARTAIDLCPSQALAITEE